MRVRAPRPSVGTSLLTAALLAAATALPGAQAPAGAPAPSPQGAAAGVQGTPAQDTERGAAVLAEARKAIGGAEKLAAIERLEVRGKSARAIGTNVLEGDFEFQIEQPDKFRRHESINMGSGGIELTQILNGAEITEQTEFVGGGGFDDFDGGGGGRGGRGRGGRGGQPNIGALLGGAPVDANADPATQQAAQRNAAASELARFTMAFLLTTTAPVAWIGTAESPDGTADVLEFRTPDGVATRVLVDAKSRMPLMLSWTGVPPQVQFGGRGGRGGRGRGGDFGGRGGDAGGRGGRAGRGGAPADAPTTLTMYLSDYKTVSGIRLPHLIQRGPNGETTEELVVRNFRINPSFKADTFSK